MPASSEPAPLSAYAFDVLILIAVCGLTFVVFRAFVRRFGFSGWLALPIAISWGLLTLWAGELPNISGYKSIYSYIETPWLFVLIWYFLFLYLAYFYRPYCDNRYRSFASPSDILLAGMALPYIGLVTTSIWLALTVDKRDQQLSSGSKATFLGRFGMIAPYFIVPLIATMVI